MRTHALAPRALVMGPVLAILLIALAPAALGQSISFDGEVQENGLSFSFSRPGTAVDSFGNLVGPNVPRFDRPRLFCAPPQPTQILTGANNVSILGSGVSQSGEPVLIIYRHVERLLEIHVGADAAESFYNDQPGAGTTYQFDLLDAEKEGLSNLLAGQTGLNGGTADIPNRAFQPAVCAVAGDLIFFAINMWSQIGVNYRSDRVAFAYTTLDRLDEADPFILIGVDKSLFLSHKRLAGWSLTKSYRSTDEPDEVFFSCADYRANQKNGFRAHLTRAIRDPETNTWTVERPILVAENFSGPDQGEHLHSIITLDPGDGWLDVVMFVGDGLTYNRTLATSLPSEHQDSLAHPEWLLTDTGINGEFQIAQRSPHWTGSDEGEPGNDANQIVSRQVDIVNGGPIGSGYEGIQSVGLAMSPQPGRFLTGGDESLDTILEGEYDRVQKNIRWWHLFEPMVTTNPFAGSLAFMIRHRNPLEPNGPVVAHSGSPNNWGAPDREDQKALFSPDGHRFCQCFAAGESNHSPPYLLADRIVVGSSGVGQGLRSTPIPMWLEQRPYQHGSNAGRNRLLAEVIIGQVADNNTLTPVSELARDVPPPPCQGTIVEAVWRDEGAAMPAVTLTAAQLPADFNHITLRWWAYIIPFDGVDYTSKNSFGLNTRVVGGAGGVHLKTWKRMSGSSQWIPFVHRIDRAAFTSPDAFEDDWALQIIFRTMGVNVHPQHAYIAFESVTIDDNLSAGIGASPEADAPLEETASITGFPETPSWTILLRGMMPLDQWDHELTDGTLPGLFSLHAGTAGKPQVSIVELVADRANLALAARLDAKTLVTGGNGVYWRRSSPLVLALRKSGSSLTIDYSVGASPMFQMSTDVGDFRPDELRFDAPMLWFSVESDASALSDEQILQWATTFDYRIGDLNSDGVVNTLDLLIMLNAWGPCPDDSDCPADLEADGTVNVLDLLVLFGNWG